jgi:hypothetical protein
MSKATIKPLRLTMPDDNGKLVSKELFTRDDLEWVAQATAAAAGYHSDRAKAHAKRVVARMLGEVAP